jgi:hypothetical protein
VAGLDSVRRVPLLVRLARLRLERGDAAQAEVLARDASERWPRMASGARGTADDPRDVLEAAREAQERVGRPSGARRP